MSLIHIDDRNINISDIASVFLRERQDRGCFIDVLLNDGELISKYLTNFTNEKRLDEEMSIVYSPVNNSYFNIGKRWKSKSDEYYVFTSRLDRFAYYLDTTLVHRKLIIVVLMIALFLAVLINVIPLTINL